MMRRTPMKRTAFARVPSGPRHIADILAETIAPRMYRVPAPSAPIFVQTPKHEYVRDEEYRRYVASHACFTCGIRGRSQAAHSNSASDGKGGSIKASDAAIFPLCTTTLDGIGCHEKHDQAKDGLTREQRRAREVEWITQMESIAALEGYRRKDQR